MQPETTGEIRIDLPATTDCDAADAISTQDGRPLSHSLSETVAVPADRTEMWSATPDGPGSKHSCRL